MPSNDDSTISYGVTASCEVLLTCEAGDKMMVQENIRFSPGVAAGDTVIRVRPSMVKQTLLGIGSSFTESAAFVLAHLDEPSRDEVMRAIYSEQGANFSLARTPIGSTDFCVDGKYSYADVEASPALSNFSISVDQDGFSSEQHEGIKDENFDLLPMIHQAMSIKAAQQDADLRIIASAWTAPPWMKDNADWYEQGSGGSLKPDYETIYADYLIKYIEAYRQQGVELWGLTPVNEPLGNNGQWESMHFTAESQRDFIKHYLGPKLRDSGNQGIELLMLDHSRTDLETWADVIYRDDDCADFVSGAAVHWYESSFKVYEDAFDRVHEKYPQYSIIHSEGCIDDLGKDAPDGILDPVGYKESDWFANDDFWWNCNASDWAYSATWDGVNAEDHPMYTPVHRYARNIIVSLNHWVTGWVDWNVVLDACGGPNHVGNFCGAPIMIDTASGTVYYTPIYYILAQFSRSIRPGDQAVQVDTFLTPDNVDCLYACASINDENLLSLQVLNCAKQPMQYELQLGNQVAQVNLTANALQTIRVQLYP
jgi:glucosylceramidase